MKRTYNDALSDVTDAPDLQHLVQDKRSLKRASSAKGRRRNRRYENRILSAQSPDGSDSDDFGDSSDLSGDLSGDLGGEDDLGDDEECDDCDDELGDGLEADS